MLGVAPFPESKILPQQVVKTNNVEVALLGIPQLHLATGQLR